MQKKDGRAAASYVVSDFRVIRTDDLHAAIISTWVTGEDAYAQGTRYVLVACCPAAGTCAWSK